MKNINVEEWNSINPNSVTSEVLDMFASSNANFTDQTDPVVEDTDGQFYVLNVRRFRDNHVRNISQWIDSDESILISTAVSQEIDDNTTDIIIKYYMQGVSTGLMDFDDWIEYMGDKLGPQETPDQLREKFDNLNGSGIFTYYALEISGQTLNLSVEKVHVRDNKIVMETP